MIITETVRVTVVAINGENEIGGRRTKWINREVDKDLKWSIALGII